MVWVRFSALSSVMESWATVRASSQFYAGTRNTVAPAPAAVRIL